ncbi:E3 ubiquitin-protein ligase hakai [Plakobranchus ocellatus]|uniref:E3 ubiquitin-protein ligase Hakai n=1 Tax=Plakobranchus ocellatus TaxID=259542 RepID=A0AAV3Y1T1_9GAST|nr:E3 ubiquitin-protein ligase hakai [Plakobranchus ocellatus]
MSVLDDFAEEEVVENPTLRAAYNAEPLHQNEPLHWDYKVLLVGEKMFDKTIHLCEICELPILVYGRMLPCKHIFCFDCARKCDKTCRRCNGKVQKVEKSPLGSVYVCTHGALKHSTKGCRRTYLSQRDLQSHHTHRHTKPSSSKQQTVQGTSGTALATAQPIPNQLPMTQQQAQAQQQAAQQKPQVPLGQAHSPAIQTGTPTSMASRGLLSPPQAQPMSMPGGIPSQIGGMMISSNNAQSSPLIPNLGGLSAGIGNQASPHMQPSVSPKSSLQQSQQHQSMGMSYSGQSVQPNPTDMYRPVDLANIASNPMSQQQMHLQQQDMHLTSGPHMQQGMQGSQPSFGQAAHFQTSTSQMQQQQQIGMNTLQPNQMPPSLHMSHHQQQHQQRQGSSVSQNRDSFSPQNHQQNVASSPGMSVTMSVVNTSQPRTNVNLITVPIQDESQYRPLPYDNTSMMNQPNVSLPAFNSQARSNLGTHVQSFPPPGMSPSFPSKFSGAVGGVQTQNLLGGGNDQNQSRSFNPGQSNPPNLGFNQGELNRQALGVNFNHPGGQSISPRLSFPKPPNQNNPTNIGFNQSGMQQKNAQRIGSFTQGLRMNQLPGMPGVGGGGNMPRGFANVVQAMSMVAAARSQGVSVGAGMMPTSVGLNTQSGGGNNRFPGPQGRWPSHGMQPRMGGNQAQPRPHDGSFKQGPYYK